MAYVRFCGAPSEWRISTTFGCVYFTALAYLNLNNPQASRRAFIGKKLLKTELLRTDNNDPVETPVKLRQQLLSPMPISWPTVQIIKDEDPFFHCNLPVGFRRQRFILLFYE